jgi:Spy/CpxP family protein refolding chaperone
VSNKEPKIGDNAIFKQLKKKRAHKAKSSAVSRASFNISDVPAGTASGGGGGGGNKRAPIGRLFPGGRKYALPGIEPRTRTVIIKSRYIPNTGIKTLNRLTGWLDYCVNDKDLKQRQKELEKEVEKDGPARVEEELKLKTEERDDRVEESNERQQQEAQKLHGGLDKAQEQSKREKSFFSSDREGITRDEAFQIIHSNFGRRVGYHQMILSPGDKDVDARDYARKQMETLEKELGHGLTWVANIHADTGEDKRHINVTIAGAIRDFDPKLRERYESNEIDIDRVDDRDKFVTADGRCYTKFHSLDDLMDYAKELKRNRKRDPISVDDFKNKLWKWIGVKGYHGPNAYGTPPLKDLEKEQELGGYEPRELDPDRIPAADKVDIGDISATKYDSAEQLKAIIQSQQEAGLKLDDAAQQKLGTWIADKERYGDEVYGLAPRTPEAFEHKTRMGLDVSQIPDADQIKICGQIYTKYDTEQNLKNLGKQARHDHEFILTGEQKSKLKEWIETKQRDGADAYGKPPMKELEKGEPNLLDKTFINLQFKLSELKSDVDRMAYELTHGKTISPQGAKFNAAVDRAAKMIEQVSTQAKLKTSWNDRGDVYIDNESLRNMRDAGNYELHIQRSFDRELERAIERELGQDRDRDKERGRVRGFGNPTKIAQKLKQEFGKVFGTKSSDNSKEKSRQDEEATRVRDENEPEKEQEKEKPKEQSLEKTKEKEDKDKDRGEDEFKKRRR